MVRIAMLINLLSPGGSIADGGLSKNWASLGAMIDRAQIESISVLRFPDGMARAWNATREELRAQADYTIAFRMHGRRSFSSLLTEVSIQERTRGCDLQWAVLLFDSKGKEIGSLFVDSFGENGYLDDRSVSFHSNDPEANLVKRLRALLEEATH
jgi:hypothetical protein